MQWIDHKDLEGKHAFLGASNFRWINWNEQEFRERYYTQFATQTGTAIHQLAHDCIVSRIKITKHDKHLIDLCLYHAYIPSDAYNSEEFLDNLVLFINDAIGFHMSSEVLLYYSEFCFGTADAISFNEIDNTLRVHDLKTGVAPAHFEQLLLYAALFCLEYHKNPKTFKTELRIYQNPEVIIYNPESIEIGKYMDLIASRSKTILGFLEREGK